ncbi:MAG TPA: shikimate dehydrogenase [Frankiaceae bacterium]|nr:shikimate dehydrogenase [Frankiaceae bacterium]
MKAAIVGSPVQHSLSPVIWRAAYESLGLKDWTYDVVETDEPGLARHLRVRDYAGLSVTMPLKHAAARLVDRRVGRTGGSVNTIVFTDDGTEGHNTDVDGVSAALTQVAPSGVGRVAILGAGGTAAAAVLAASALRATAITLVARNAGPANDLREKTGGVAHFAPWTHVREEVDKADVVVNTTPKHAADELAKGWRGKPLVDVLYDPWPTALAAAAQAGGHPVAGGLVVLVHQAVRQIELVTGKRPDPAVLMAAAEAAAR